MASVSLFVFFLVSYLGLLLSAGQEESSYTQNCRRLLCGDLEKIGFPFIDITDPKCYVGIVNCNEETHQTIQLGTGERQYELTSIGRIPEQPNAYVLGIRDQKLSENLTYGRCKFITNPTILPRFPFISLQIKSHNRTFVKCDKAVKKFGWMQSSDIKCEDGYYLYDGHPSDGFPPGCSPIQLPIKPRPSESEPYPVEFELLVNVSDDCSPCHEKEGQCQIDRNIYCPKKGKKSKVLAIALGLVSSAWATTTSATSEPTRDATLIIINL